MGIIQVWRRRIAFHFQFRSLEDKARMGLLTLYREVPGESRTVRMGGRDWREGTAVMDLVAENGEAWRLIREDPGALRLALTCRQCGCAHVFLSARPLGRFDEAALGIWSCDLFRLIRPGLVFPADARRLTCPRCWTRRNPILRRFPAPLVAEKSR